jgi:hypothetical protein
MGKRWWWIVVAIVLALGTGFVGGWFAHRHPATCSVSATEGIISGRFIAAGGTPAESGMPLPGMISVANIQQTGPPIFDVPVEADGSFCAAVDPGVYDVMGVSPMFKAGHVSCPADENPVKVAQGARVTVTVSCDMR